MPDIITVVVIPFIPGAWKASELIAIGTNIPRFRDMNERAEQWILLNGLKQGSLAVEAVGSTPHHGRQIIAKTIYPGRRNPMTHGGQNEVHDGRAVCIKRIAAARVIHQYAI